MNLLKKLLNPNFSLVLILLIYSVILLLTYSQSYYPAGVNTSTHLFQILLFQEEGFTSWNHWWYAGNPQLDIYPPFSHIVPALFSKYIGVELSYKLFFSLFFLLLPFSFYLFLKEFNLKGFQSSVALYFFSFSSIFVHYLQGGVFAALISVPLIILFLKFFINFLNSKSSKSLILSSVFLAFTALTHLFMPVAAIIMAFIYTLSFHRNLDGFKSLIHLGVFTGILVIFFWIPMYFNYDLATFGFSLSLETLTAPFELIGRAFFSYFNLLSISASAILGLVLLSSLYLFYKSKNNFALFLILLILIPSILMFTLPSPYTSFMEGKFVLLYPIFFGLIIGSVYGKLKYLDILVKILLLLMFMMFIIHPIFYIPDEIYSVAKWSASQINERALFLPQGFGLLMDAPDKPNADEYLYSTYLMPVFGKEVYNGWFGEFAPRTELDQQITFSCQKTFSFSELFSKISILDNTILHEIKKCEISATPEFFCSVVQQGSIDTIFTNSNFPEVEKYVQSLQCIHKLDSYGPLTAYKILDSESYVNHGFTYTKSPGKISVALPCSFEGEMIIKETYSPHWKAYIDGKEVELYETELGYIKLNVKTEKWSNLELYYMPDRFFNIPLAISAFGWLAVLILLFNSSLLRNLQRKIHG